MEKTKEELKLMSPKLRYYYLHKDRVKEYRKNNLEKYRAIRKKYELLNPEKVKLSKKKWDDVNKEKKLQYKKLWLKENPNYYNEYIKKRKKEDKEFHLTAILRARITHAVKAKKLHKTMEYVGCTKGELLKHLELQFKDGMNWGNYGKWHIDHIIPISSFNLSDEKQIFQAMNFTNLQPLWAQDNLRKSNKMLNL